MEFTQFTVASEDFRKFSGDILVYCFVQSDEGLFGM